jgi:general secretion pathway protein K
MRPVVNTNERAVAMVLVMWVILVLSLLIGGFAFTMHVETQVASFRRKELKAELLARSGVEVARMQLVLAQQSASNALYDARNQVWAANGELYVDHELGEGKYSVTVIDEESKLPASKMTEEHWTRLLTLLNVDPFDADVIVDSILDWIDEDDRHRLNGAEDDYYLTLQPPYRAKNGHLDRIDELLLVRGVTRELFQGRPAPKEDEIAQPGLPDLLTTTSSGQVNVNTAGPLVLKAWFGLDDVRLDTVLSRRNGQDGLLGTDDDQPFASAQDFAKTSGGESAPGGTVKSTFFTIKSTGEVAGVKRTIVTTVRRQNGQVTVVLWRELRGAEGS